MQRTSGSCSRSSTAKPWARICTSSRSSDGRSAMVWGVSRLISVRHSDWRTSSPSKARSALPSDVCFSMLSMLIPGPAAGGLTNPPRLHHHQSETRINGPLYGPWRRKSRQVAVLPKRRIGATPVEVTEFGFGGTGLGNIFTVVREDDAVATIRAALAAGIRYFDTAPLYGHRLSELRTGAALRLAR